MTTALVLLSGGLDSVVLAYKLKAEGVKFDALFIDFGKNSTRNELEHSRGNAVSLGAGFEHVDISSLSKSFIGYVTSQYVTLDELDRAGDTHITVIGDRPKAAIVNPSGFPIALSIASYLGAISGRNKLFVGIIQPQATAVSTTANFFQSWGDTLSLLNTPDWRVDVETPLIAETKAGAISIGHKLGVPFERTWSCLRAGDIHCGECVRCVERRKGFQAAGIADPTPYQK